MDGIKKFTLDNGLTVLLKEVHTAPVISLWAWYRVGSRDEQDGGTGLAHWIEHLLSARFKYQEKNSLNFIAQLGGVGNASTFFDYTNYYATLPAGSIDVAISMEAERMQMRAFDLELAETERQVIINERRWKENEPDHRLYESLLATAFQIHPYRRPVIGYMCDLENMPLTVLQEFHSRYYQPSNAFIVAVGAFKTDNLLKQIEQHLGSIRPGTPPLPPYAVEPAQQGERRLVLNGEGKTSYLQMAIHIPEADHADFPAIAVLNAILSGAGPTHATSRLYRSLVDAELAVDISCSTVPTIDPFLLTLGVTVRTGHTPQEAEAVIDEQLQRIAADQVDQAELQKAIKQARAQFAYSSESVTRQALWYGWSEIFADFTWFDGYLDRLAAVTLDDIQRVAGTYLGRNNRTVGYYLPNNGQNS
jgi:zinc protease